MRPKQKAYIQAMTPGDSRVSLSRQGHQGRCTERSNTRAERGRSSHFDSSTRGFGDYDLVIDSTALNFKLDSPPNGV